MISAVAPIAAGNPAIQTPAPMLSPPFPTCEGFVQAIAGDTCDTIAPKAGSMDEFLRLNPGLAGGAGCESGNVNPGYFYCVKALPSAPDGKNKGSPPPAGEQDRGDKMPKPTKKPKEEEPAAPNPTTMPVPKCEFGDCWKSWIDVSTAQSEDMLKRAHKSCEKLYTEKECKSMGGLDFPAPIKEGCDNCMAMMSGCSCWLEGGYHTYTIGYVYGDDSDAPNLIDPNMKKRAH